MKWEYSCKVQLTQHCTQVQYLLNVFSYMPPVFIVPWDSTELALRTTQLLPSPGLFHLSNSASCLLTLTLACCTDPGVSTGCASSSCPAVRHLPDNTACLGVMSAWHLVKKKKKNNNKLGGNDSEEGQNTVKRPPCCANINAL